MLTRKSGIQLIFGTRKEIRNSAIAVIPLFSPLTYDNFTEGQYSKLLKYQYMSLPADVGLSDEIGNTQHLPEGKTARQVPLFSDVLVWDDYQAFAHFNRLFADHGYGAIELWDDQTVIATAHETDEYQWWQKKFMLVLGSARSNQFLRLLFAMWGLRNVANLRQAATNLDQWHAILSVTTASGIEERYLPDADSPIDTTAYSVIFKRHSPHPRHKESTVLCVVGDCSESTQLSAYLLCHDIDTLAAQVGNQSFLLLLKTDRAALQKAARGGRKWASVTDTIRRELFLIEEETGYVSPVTSS